MRQLLTLFGKWSNSSKEKCHYLMILLFIISYLTLSAAQSNTDTIDTTITNEQEASKLFKRKKSYTKRISDSLLVLTGSYIKEGKFPDALYIIDELLITYKSLNESKLIGDCYNRIAVIHYYQGAYKKAIEYYDLSIAAYKIADFKEGLASAINNKGAIFYFLGNYPKALAYYKRAVSLDKGLKNNVSAASTILNIGGIYLMLEDYANAIKYFQKAKETFESISDNKGQIRVFIGIGEVHLKQSDYENAQINFDKALELALKFDDKQKVIESHFMLGEVYYNQIVLEKSIYSYQRAFKLSLEINNVLYQSRSLIAIGSIENKIGNNQIAIVNCKRGFELAEELEIIPTQEKACQCLYNTYKSLNQSKKALAYYEKSIRLKDSIQEKKTSNQLQNMEFEKEVLLDSIAHVEKERKLQKVHKQEIAKKEKQRNILVISGCFVLVFAGGLWSRLRYTSKSKARLQIEKDRSEHLLLNILPEEIAEELKEKGYVDAQDFETASILFTDFKSFTETAAKLSPQELVEEINVCFKAFDEIMGTYEIEKIKTIGDAYMAAGGLPKPDSKAVKNIILAGLAMQEFTIKRKLNNMRQNKPAFEMRVGIHVGPIVAGIVGIKKFQYDIWGDTVNTASRMESNGDVGKVNISQYTYELVKGESDLAFEYRGKVAVKGKGELPMYFVEKARN